MIRCNEYDYIELVCLYRYPIRLTMKVGAPIQGGAVDTSRNDNAKECIKISVNGRDRLVELAGIAKLDVLVDNPHLSELVF